MTSQEGGLYIEISVTSQQLNLYQASKSIFQASVSSAINGCGELQNSGCTPRGWHQIRAKIGTACAVNTVFRGRRPSGEIYNEALANRYPDRDWILSRILWLSGEEVGRNRLGQVDTMRRYIYLHGTPDSEPMGVARSHGCIRMRNTDIIELYDLIPVHTRVLITE
ncbi:MAG: L,D-transpeptidase [Gammaproteobacteria bacterium]|nr:L,D-transpeptidase [Gammaproteobacteria bacterium]